MNRHLERKRTISYSVCPQTKHRDPTNPKAGLTGQSYGGGFPACRESTRMFGRGLKLACLIPVVLGGSSPSLTSCCASMPVPSSCVRFPAIRLVAVGETSMGSAPGWVTLNGDSSHLLEQCPLVLYVPPAVQALLHYWEVPLTVRLEEQ